MCGIFRTTPSFATMLNGFSPMWLLNGTN
jgi:hypothetical protein